MSDKWKTFFKCLWIGTKKVLWTIGICLFFVFFGLFYFAKICINDKK